MKFENKANLLFLLVIVLALAPGGYKLFMKKLDPEASAMYLPEPVARSIAYVAPLPAPPGSVARVVPPRTGAWVASLVRSNTDADRVEMAGPEGDPQPLVGERWGFQVGSVVPAEGGVDVGMIVWDKRAYAGAEHYAFDADFGGGRVATTRPAAVRVVLLPQQVRRELQNFGFIDPPEQVVWAAVTFDRPAGVAPDARPVGYAMRYDDGETDMADRLAVAPIVPPVVRATGAEMPVAQSGATR